MEAGDSGGGRDSVFARALSSDWIPPGLFFFALGAAAYWVSHDYPLGDLNRMGPGYFPRMLSVGMMLLGALVVAKGVQELPKIEGKLPRLDRSFFLVLLSMALFGVLVERIGLVASLVVSLAVAGLAHREARAKEVAISIVTLISLSLLVFVIILKLPLRLWPDF
jgi:hypothetical protein